MRAIRVGDFLFNPIALLIFAYILGLIMRLLARAGSAARSTVNKYPTRWSFVKKNWDIFVVRSFIISLFFAWWVKDPGAWSRGLATLGIAAGIANWLTFPPTLTTAPAFGFLGDYGLDQLQVRLATKYPWLPDIIKGEVPNYDSAVVDVDRLSKERKVGE